MNFNINRVKIITTVPSNNLEEIRKAQATYKYSDELLYEKIKPFIGKFIIRKEDETKWLNIMELIQNKVNQIDTKALLC